MFTGALPRPLTCRPFGPNGAVPSWRSRRSPPHQGGHPSASLRAGYGPQHMAQISVRSRRAAHPPWPPARPAHAGGLWRFFFASRQLPPQLRDRTIRRGQFLPNALSYLLIRQPAPLAGQAGLNLVLQADAVEFLRLLHSHHLPGRTATYTRVRFIGQAPGHPHRSIAGETQHHPRSVRHAPPFSRDYTVLKDDSNRPPIVPRARRTARRPLHGRAAVKGNTRYCTDKVRPLFSRRGGGRRYDSAVVGIETRQAQRRRTPGQDWRMTHFSWYLDGSIVGLYLVATMVAGIMVRKYVGDP